jgi:ketosteroid isomerase-like protein
MSMRVTKRSLHRGGRILFHATIAVFALVSGAMADDVQSHPSAAEAAVLKAEDRLFDADVKHDTATIADGFADEAIFVHANGMTQTKADYLSAAASGKVPVHSISAQDRVVRVFGDVAVVRGTKNLVVGDYMHLSGTYLTVYVKRNGRWLMLDSQSSPAPKNAPPP